MTPKIIVLKQAPVVLVELPYHPNQIIDGLGRTKFNYGNEVFGDWITIKNIPEFDSILGILSDLTEEQSAECVDAYEVRHNMDLTIDYAYKDYTDGIPEEENIDYDYWDEYAFDTAKESFDSLLESENVYTENPYGEKSPAAVVMVGGMELLNTGGAIAKANRRRLEQWQEAQSRTIDPKRTVVLIKKEN